MISKTEAKQRRELFTKFCNLVCPDYLNLSKNLVNPAMRNLNNDFDLEELVSQAKKFKQKFPKGIKITKKDHLTHIQQEKNNGIGYKERLSQLIRENTKIELYPVSVIPSAFYESIVKYCIK